MHINDKMYKLLPTQIPYFWDAIKFCVTKVDEIDKENLPNYFTELLHSLLTENAQCWVVIDENRTLISIAITRIMIDKMLNKKQLLGQSMYTIRKMDDDDYIRYYAMLTEFAKKQNCDYIVFNSRNPRMWDIGIRCGCTERYRTFEYRIGG